VPATRLAGNMVSGGLVTRLALEMTPSPAPQARLRFTLRAPAQVTLTPGPDKQTLRVRLTALATENPEPLRTIAPGRYDIDAFQTDVATLLKSLSRDGDASVVMAGANTIKVTVNLHNVTTEQAIDLLAKAAGLIYHKNGNTYLVGTAKEVDAAYPSPQVETPVPPAPVMKQEIYCCRHIVAPELVTTLTSVFEKEGLKVTLGASASTTRLDDAATESVTGVQASIKSGGGSGVATGGAQNGLSARIVILSGEQGVVARALKLAQELDVRRRQVKINVQIVDISTDALKQLGVQWTWSQYNVSEQTGTTAGGATTATSTGATTTTTTPASTASTTVNGLNFGVFAHMPVSISATVAALEQHNQAKLLAAPSLSLLDGERSFILIGERLLYPKLTGYTQSNTPIYDKEEVKVGIYLQVSVQIAVDGEITLTLYPQVSTVTGYLNVGGASYPQISTREQQTTIRVTDGQQIIVGGLLHEEELHSIQRVPILANIPLFGELFTYRNTTRSKDELVMMLTPQLLKD
jgi:type IV pilus assembly protein PilQ